MKRRLPPLNALRVFEVAARHMSFSRAAAEISVTNAAVSHQIRRLEETLGVTLFRRQHNRLALTPAGENYVPRIREAFRAIEQATDAIIDTREAVVRIGTSPAFASKWLVPRMYRFFNLHPEIRLELTTEESLDPRAYDLCLDDRRTVPSGFHSECLAHTDFVPVCAPALGRNIRSLHDLQKCMLLHIRSTPGKSRHPEWQRWFDEAGGPAFDTRHGLFLSDELMALQVAIDGQGVMLGQRLLVDYDVMAERLSLPLDIRASSILSYYMITASGAPDHSALSILKKWLIDEIHMQGFNGGT